MNILDFLKEADRLTKNSFLVKSHPVLRSAYQSGNMFYATDSDCIFAIQADYVVDEPFSQEIRFDNFAVGDLGTFPDSLEGVLIESCCDVLKRFDISIDLQKAKNAYDSVKVIKNDRIEMILGSDFKMRTEESAGRNKGEVTITWEINSDRNPEIIDRSFFSTDKVLFLLNLFFKESENKEIFPVTVYWGGKTKSVVFKFSNINFLMMPLIVRN